MPLKVKYHYICLRFHRKSPVSLVFRCFEAYFEAYMQKEHITNSVTDRISMIGLVAQWIEQQPSKLWVARSNRAEITKVC